MQFSKDDKDLRTLADKVIKKYDLLQTLKENKSQVRIGYQWSEKEKLKDGMLVFGDCEKVKDKLKEFIDQDFIITFYPCAKDISDKAREILMYHELRHIGIKHDENGNIYFFVVSHTIEDFRDIVEEYGIDWIHNI